MATVSEEDNPIPVNVVALIDILMCLLLFYMCAAKFAANEGRMDAFLPKSKGCTPGLPLTTQPLDEVRVRLSWENDKTVFRFGARMVAQLSELETLVRAQWNDLQKASGDPGSQVPVVLEVAESVPAKDAVHVMDLCRKNQITNIEFALRRS